MLNITYWEVYMFKNISRNARLIVGCIILFGLLSRVSQYFHLGFYYDLIETQYDWANWSVERGFVAFWQQYRPTGVDYLPGAIYVISTLQWLNTVLWDGKEYGFVFLIKLFNTFQDLIFAGLVTYLAQTIGKVKISTALYIGSTTFLLPSLWFISAVWGQFDTFPINMSLALCLMLYRGIENSSKKLTIGAGVMFGIILWFKLQAMLLLPAFILLWISYKKRKPVVQFFSGFALSSIVMLIVPILANGWRVGYAIGQVVIRSNNVTNGAYTFWPLVNMVKYGTDDWFNIGSYTITASKFAYFVYLILMSGFVYCLFNDKELLNYRVKTVWNHIQQLSFQSFILITSISSSIYFFFFTKMMSRYLHWGYLFAIVWLALIWNNKKHRVTALVGLGSIEIGYFLNQVGVYGWWNGTPSWPEWMVRNTPMNSWNLASWFHLIGIGILYYTSIRYLLNQQTKE